MRCERSGACDPLSGDCFLRSSYPAQDSAARHGGHARRRVDALDEERRRLCRPVLLEQRLVGIETRADLVTAIVRETARRQYGSTPDEGFFDGSELGSKTTMKPSVLRTENAPTTRVDRSSNRNRLSDRRSGGTTKILCQLTEGGALQNL